MSIRIDINVGEKHGSKGEHAYTIYRAFPRCVDVPWIYHFRTAYDCDGVAFGGIHYFRCTMGFGADRVTAKVYGIGAPYRGDFPGIGVLEDVRTLKMIQAGCCPPAILEEFMSAEGLRG